ncbi:DUF2304 domain-containing protein [Microbacterium aurantiacum]|uniref:DUF2304 domain-containing protein n=1 Tax=Microbacterium aurantiacum TaxID=162393 RepID=A0AAJ2HH44_9MICO|nr:DUF2304 domain-containing protein [Microbacterium aurantiacum]MDS0243993.1 DUF2304 domain-containing protein [Microbacterium aurantiacum]
MIVLLGVGLALVILIIVVWMLLTRTLREKYAVMWLVIALAVLVLGLFPQLLSSMTNALGVQLPSNLLFAIAIVLLLGVALHLSWELSQAENEIRRLAEESAIARTEIDRLSDRVRSIEADRRHDDEF